MMKTLQGNIEFFSKDSRMRLITGKFLEFISQGVRKYVQKNVIDCDQCIPLSL
jgi:hypothetical protein